MDSDKRRISNDYIKFSNPIILSKERTQSELEAGIQTIQYQINTLMTTNGQSPFVTLFLHIDDEDEYEEEPKQKKRPLNFDDDD